jgi:hypothetical protein
MESKGYKTKTYGLVFSAILILCFSVARADGEDLVQVSQDPYTDPLAQHATEVEPVMVANGDTIVTAFQVGRFEGVGSDNIGWATSTNAGRSWKHGFLTGTTPVAGGTWAAVSLPVIAYDRKHKKYLISMMPFDDQQNGRGVLVSRSSDGLNWSQPVVAASSLSTDGHWLACDNSTDSPFYGNCYDAFLDFSSGTASLNNLVTSNDGGLTWGTQVSSPDQLAGLVTSIAIQPNGNLVVLGRNGGPDGTQEYAIPSVDGGATLQATANITTNLFDFPFMRADPSPSSGVDSHGTIYVVFPDCRFRNGCVDPFDVSGCRFTPGSTSCPTNDLVLTKSTDGVNWSEPERIPIDPVTSNTDHFITGLGVLSEPDEDHRSHSDGVHTKLALTYYFLPNGGTCIQATCRVDAGFIFSDDGGRSWNDATKIAGPMLETSLVPTFAGEMVADYISAVFVDGKPYSAFAIAHPPNRKTGRFDEAIYAVKLPKDGD